MTELDKTKLEAAAILRKLCARCKDGIGHDCPVRQVVREIEAIRGVPIIVNDRLYHVMFN